VAISSGIYSLAGVLIGGGLTTGSQVYLDRRREQREDRSEQRAVRAAKRQVAAELFEVSAAIRELHDEPESTEVRHLLRSDLWRQYAPVLANEECYTAIWQAHVVADATVRFSGEHRDWDKANAKDAYHLIVEALAALAVSGVPAPPALKDADKAE
jgi:hypothetical protein